MRLSGERQPCGTCQRHAGVLIVPQRQHVAHEDLALRASELLNQEPNLANRLYEWTVARGWVLDPVP